MDHAELMRENSALIALLRTCERPDTWTSIANDCVLEGSAERLLLHKIDPSSHPLLRDDADGDDMQGTLLDDVGLSAEQVRQLEDARNESVQNLEDWRSQGFDFVSVFDTRFPERLRATIDVPPFLFASGDLKADDLGVSVVGSRHCTPEGALRRGLRSYAGRTRTDRRRRPGQGHRHLRPPDSVERWRPHCGVHRHRHRPAVSGRES